MATLGEILKLDLLSQVSNPKKSETVAPQVSTAVAKIDLSTLTSSGGNTASSVSSSHSFVVFVSFVVV